MKTLIVFSTRTGRTKKVAEELAQLLKADIEEIKELESRDGMLGYIKAGRDATFKTATEIEKPIKNPADYDLVIIGTPIWAFTMASGIRSWLTQYGKDIKKVAFFATMGGSGDKRAFAHMEELCHQAPLTTVTLIDKKIDVGEYQEALEIFTKSLSATSI